MFRKSRSIVYFLCLYFFTSLVYAQVNSNYEKAISAFDTNQLDRAYIHLKNSLNEDEQHLPSKILMGKVLALSFYYSDAIVELEEALMAGADSNLVIEYLANSLLLESRYNDIMALSEKGLSRKNLALLTAIKANASLSLDLPDAEKLFNRAISLDSASSGILNSYAQYLIQSNQVDKAMSLVNKALELEPKNTESLRLMANVYLQREQQANYIQTLEKAIDIEPSQPLVLQDLISAYIQTSQLDEAKALLVRVLESAPNDPMAKLLQSYVLTELGEIEAATFELEDLVNQLSLLTPEAIRDAYGLIYISALSNYALGNLEKAKQDLNKYLVLQPNNIKAAIILADIYSSEQNYTSAINLLEKFKDLSLNDLDFADKLCSLYLQIAANHKCTWLVTQLEPNFAGNDRYISLKARAYAARGKLSEAITTLNTIENESESLDINKVLLLIEANDLNNAKITLNRLLEKRPDSTDYQNLLASILIKSGELNKAKQTLNDIIANDPIHYSARFNLASVLFRQNELEASLTIAEKLREERPRQTNVLFLIANVRFKQKNYEQAITLINDILTFDKRFEDAERLLVRTYRELGQFNDALIIINKLVKDNFLNAEYLTLRAETLLQSNQIDKAIEDLDKLFSIYANSQGGLLALSTIQQQAGDLTGALKSLDRAIELSPKNFFILREKAKLLLIDNKADKAKPVIEALIENYPNDPDAMMLKGDLATTQQKLIEASEYYSKAIVANNNFAQALFKRYVLAMRGIEEDAFIRQYEGLVNKVADPSIIRNFLADYYLSRNNLDAAKEHYLLILRNTRYANIALVLNNLANVYQLESSFETAREYSQRAYNLNPNNQSILDTLGWSLVKLGQHKEGLDLLRRSFSMNTADPSVRYHIAYALVQLQRPDEAKRELQNLLGAFGAFFERQEAQSLLETL